MSEVDDLKRKIAEMEAELAALKRPNERNEQNQSNHDGNNVTTSNRLNVRSQQQRQPQDTSIQSSDDDSETENRSRRATKELVHLQHFHSVTSSMR